MQDATLGISLQMTSDTASPAMKSFTNTLTDNKSAIRELSMGTMMLGGSLLAMGVALKGTNSTLGQSVGQILMMVGSVTTAIGSAVRFISEIDKIVDGLHKLAESEIIVQALTNPLLPLLGIAVAGGAIAGLSALQKNEAKTTIAVTSPPIYLNSKPISDAVRADIVKVQQRNPNSGIK